MTSSQKRYWRGVIAAQFFTSSRGSYTDKDFNYSSDQTPFSQGYHDGVYGTFPEKPSGSGYWDLLPHMPRQEDSVFTSAQEKEHRLFEEAFSAFG